MLHKERFHNSHLEVINNSSSKVSMGWVGVGGHNSEVPYRQVPQAEAQLHDLTMICFYLGVRKKWAIGISYTWKNFIVCDPNLILKVNDSTSYWDSLIWV